MSIALVTRRKISPWSKRQIARRLFMAACPRRWLMIRGPVHKNSICLTFDDGPDPKWTPRILDLLQHLGVKATFFVVGKRVEESPEIVRRMVREGHCVGHHSYLHTPAKETTARQLADEIDQSVRALRELGVPNPNLFRPPFGALTVGKLWTLWLRHQRVVLWNVDPEDYSCENSSQVAAWFRDNPSKSGDIVLMHDVVPHALDVLAAWVGSVRESGLHFAGLDDWLD